MLRGIRKASSNWLGKTIMSRRHGRADPVSFARLGHRRHLQGLRTIDAGQDRQHRNLDRAIPPALHRAAAADRPPVRPAADAGPGARLRHRPPGAAAGRRRSRARRGSAAHGARAVRRRDHAHDPQRSEFQGRHRQVRPGALPGQVLRQFGYTEQRYIAEQRRVSLRRQIAGTLDRRPRRRRKPCSMRSAASRTSSARSTTSSSTPPRPAPSIRRRRRRWRPISTITRPSSARRNTARSRSSR